MRCSSKSISFAASSASSASTQPVQSISSPPTPAVSVREKEQAHQHAAAAAQRLGIGDLAVQDSAYAVGIFMSAIRSGKKETRKTVSSASTSSSGQ
jgi:hypothetical protein